MRYVNSRPALGWTTRAARALVPIAVVACSTEGEGGGTGNTTPSADIAVTVKKPVSASLVSGEGVEITGTLAATGGAKLDAVELVLPDPALKPLPCTRQGNNFTCTVDTTQKTPNPKGGPDVPVFKCGVTATLLVKATSKKPEASGTGSVEVEVDNCGPVVKLFDKEKQKLDGRVVVGGIEVFGSVTDKNFDRAQLYLRPDDSEAPTDLYAEGEEPASEFLTAIAKPGSFKFKLDRRKEQSATWKVGVIARDKLANITVLEAQISLVREPTFLGNSGDVDSFWTDIRDYKASDFDGDGLLDVVVATSEGIVLRRGQPKPLPEDAPADAPLEHSGRFDTVAADYALDDDGNAITGKDGNPVDLKAVVNAPYRIAFGSVSKLLTLDLDGDGDLDILAVGSDSEGPKAWALLAYDRTVKQPKQSDTTARSFKVLDSHALPEDALSVALADLNVDEQPDLVVGAKSDNKGLSVLLLEKEVQCREVKDGPATPCGEIGDLTKAKFASVFKKQDAQKSVNKGVTSITAIVVGDFYSADPAPDLCVGEGARPVISCYRNQKHDGTLEQAQDAYVFPDVPDAPFAVAVEWSKPGQKGDMDLVVASSNGFMRWLEGQGNGTFKFDPKNGRHTVFAVGCSGMTLADIGPAGSPYLVIAGGRAAFLVPAYPSDISHSEHCFRSWLLGGSVSAITAAFVDGDKYRDLLAIDKSPHGIATVRGLAHGEFEAPNVYHLCAWPETGTPGWHEVALAEFADLSGVDKQGKADGRPELLMVGKASWSLQPEYLKRCCPKISGGEMPYFVWPVSAYRNLGTRLDPAPRGGEFAPYAEPQAAGVASLCPDSPKQFGNAVAMRLADLNGDNVLDLALIRNGSEYALGAKPIKSEVCLKNKCVWSEANEVSNAFGEEFPPDPDDGEPMPSEELCCKNFATVNDTKKEKPLKGYGGGAPIDRASLIVLQGDKSEPMKLGASCVPFKPCVMTPVAALSAGRNPVAVVAADFDDNKKTDLAVVMKSSGNQNDENKQYLEARIRYFQNLGPGGGGKFAFAYAPVKDTWKWIAGNLHSDNIEAQYRVVGRDPIDAFIAPWGTGRKPSVFTLNKKDGQLSVVESQGAMASAFHKMFSIGDSVNACTVEDFDSDADHAPDLVCALKDSLAIVPGDLNWFKPKQTLTENLQADVGSLLAADVNKDGFKDLAYVDRKASVVEFYLGNGRGGFVHYNGQLRALESASSVTKGDLDGDGCQDLAVKSQFGVTVLRNRFCDTQK